MLWLAILIFLAAALSLLSYLYCWHDIQGGRPHILSLRQVTGIMDREEFTRRFGPPEPGYYYALTPLQRQGMLARWRGRMVAECAADGACLLSTWYGMAGFSTAAWAWLFIALPGVCQAISLGHSAWLIRRWRHQIREEIENSGD